MHRGTKVWVCCWFFFSIICSGSSPYHPDVGRLLSLQKSVLIKTHGFLLYISKGKLVASSSFLRYPEPREVLGPPKPVLVLSPKGNSSQRGSHLDPAPGSEQFLSQGQGENERVQKGLLSTWSGRLDGHPDALWPCPGWEGFPGPAEHVLSRAGDEWTEPCTWSSSLTPDPLTREQLPGSPEHSWPLRGPHQGSHWLPHCLPSHPNSQ